ncbi:MAG: hypothetical protein H6699_08230, partial [Myxococcales bacterium]|nr:hypothetical protein [Myxococcales bacterium]
AGGYEPDPLFDTGRSIASFAEDADGELYVVDFVGGSLHRLVPDGVVAEREVPTLLSATGCMDPTDPSRPGASLIPYTINVPFWSDGADKERWFALPDGAVMSVDDHGDLDLPIGSVVVKQFRFDGGAPFETRLLMHHEDGSWGGYSYRWRADGGDAELVDAEGAEAEVAGRQWTFPSRANCNSCHTEAAGRVLGLEVPQLDRDMVYPDGRLAPQLATLQHIGVVGEVPAIPRMPSAADAASTGDRARAWLHSNCAGCHQPAGPARAEFDLRWTATERNLCNVPPIDDMGIDGARLVAPFAPERSVLLQRALLRGSDEAMPPLGSAIIDAEGTALLERWISSGGCN